MNKSLPTTGTSDFRKIFIWGTPLDFSLSPFFQENAGAVNDLQIIYSIFRGGSDNFKNILCEKNCVGANITIPNKIKAVKLCDELTETAQICGAVNTVFKKDGKLVGDNTDGEGLFLWLTKNNIPQNNLDILGNGGTARSIALALSKNGYYVRIFGRKEKGWEKNFGTFYPIDKWKEEYLTVSTLPFTKKGKNIIDISYQFGNISENAAGMLACQGWLAFKKWFNSETSLETFIDITFRHRVAQSNTFLITSLCRKNEIQQIS